MDELNSARAGINGIDEEMARLFCRRMEYSRIIGEYKRRRGLPVRDEAREKELCERSCEYIGTPDYKDYYIRFLRSVIDLSCEYQEHLREEKR